MGSKTLTTVKSGAKRGYHYCYKNTVLLIDHIAQILDARLLFAVFLLASFSLALAALLVHGSVQTVKFTPEQISYLTLPDTRIQSKFYSIFCVSLFVFFLTVGLFAPQWFPKQNMPDRQISKAAPNWLQPSIAVSFWIAVLILYEPKARDFLSALAVAYFMKEAINDRVKTKFIVPIFLSACFIFFIIPLGIHPKLADGRLWTMDIHWSAVLGEGLFARMHQISPFEAFSDYGILLNELIAKARTIPVFSSLGGTQSLLMVMDIVFFGLVFVIIVERIGRKSGHMIWAAALLILLLFSEMISGMFQSLATPNLLPIRFILIPSTVIFSYYIAGLREQYGSLLFGLIIPVLIFYNFETAIYCILALGFAFFLKSAKKGFLNLIISGACIVAGSLITGILLLALFFQEPLSAAFPKLVAITALKIQSGTSGFAGLSFYFFVPFLLVMAHSMVLFSRYLLSVRDRTPINRLEFQNIVIVGLIIAIGPYVMNRFHVLNMWIPFLLYILLVLPKLSEGQKAARTFWSFIIVVLIAPFIFGNPLRNLVSKDFVAAISDRVEGRLSPCLDGVLASPELCKYATAKARELENLIAQNPDLKWISGLSLTMSRLTGTQPALDKKALFFFAYREETRNIILNSLKQLHAPVIAIDNAAAGNIAGIPEAVERFQTRLIQDTGYQITDETKYWMIARKRYP